MINIKTLSGKMVQATVQSDGTKVALCIHEPAVQGRGAFCNANMSANAARELAGQLTAAADEIDMAEKAKAEKAAAFVKSAQDKYFKDLERSLLQKYGSTYGRYTSPWYV